MAGMIGNLAALEAVKHLTGMAEPVIVGRKLVVDVHRMETQFAEGTLLDDCAACGPDGRVPARCDGRRPAGRGRLRIDDVTSTLADATVVRLHPLHIGEARTVCARSAGSTPATSSSCRPRSRPDPVAGRGSAARRGPPALRRPVRHRAGPRRLPRRHRVLRLRAHGRRNGEGGASGGPATGRHPPAVDADRRGIAVLANLSPHRVAWLLAPPMRLLYVGGWLTVPVLLVLVPALRPTRPTRSSWTGCWPTPWSSRRWPGCWCCCTSWRTRPPCGR
ncbi:hypothetical protein NKG94_15615 [Micromonospora sp. M12]